MRDTRLSLSTPSLFPLLIETSLLSTKRSQLSGRMAPDQKLGPSARVRHLLASVVMQRLSYLTETVFSNKITRNRIVLSFKDSTRKP